MAIRSFRRKGLERFFNAGSKTGVQAKLAKRLRLILSRLNAAAHPHDLALPGLVLHELQGRRAGTWTVGVSGHWRITFKMAGKDVVDVDYEDYH